MGEDTPYFDKIGILVWAAPTIQDLAAEMRHFASRTDYIVPRLNSYIAFLSDVVMP
jgi:hypothetical protein